MNYLASAATFLVSTVFGFFIVLFLVRMLLLAVGAPFHDPICRFVYQLTNPVVTPLRRFVPRWGRIELASLLVAFVLIVLEFALYALFGARAAGPLGFVLLGLATLLNWLIWIELVAIFVRCILSFFVNPYYNESAALLIRVTDPVVRPFRRLPPLGGLDFSPWFAMIALVLAQILLVAPLLDLAARL